MPDLEGIAALVGVATWALLLAAWARRTIRHEARSDVTGLDRLMLLLTVICLLSLGAHLGLGLQRQAG